MSERALERLRWAAFHAERQHLDMALLARCAVAGDEPAGGRYLGLGSPSVRVDVVHARASRMGQGEFGVRRNGCVQGFRRA